MRKFINATHISGYVYDTKKLELKTAGPTAKTPGQKFISGELKIATDEDCLNIVSVFFTYVTPTTAKGQPNDTFNILYNIIDGQSKTVMNSSKEQAVKVRCDSAIGLLDFYDKKDGALVSVKRNDGGFLHLMPGELEPEDKSATFKCDMIITGVRRIEADPDKEQPEKMILKGATSNFRNALLPIEVVVDNPAGMDYYESLDISDKNPLFTQVKGVQRSTTVVKQIVEESAWGEPSIREVRDSRKEWVVTWSQPEPYVWGDETTITDEDMTKMIADRELYLADTKRKQDEYAQQKASSNVSSAVSASTGSDGGFKF